jgi:outer membrane lipoprotein carrier protein
MRPSARSIARVATLAALLTGFAGSSHSLLAAGPSAAEVAQGIQHEYDSVKDFSSDFTHVYQGGVLKKQVTEHGKVLIKKPGKMRWEYAAPDNNLFISDGVKIYSYIPADKQVIVSAVPPEDEAATPALFLAGKGNLTRDFTVSLVEPAKGTPAGTLALKLVPKQAQPEYDWLILEVEPGTYRLRGLVFIDAQGGTSTYTFTNLKENVGLADKEFEFKAPRGVDVVTDSTSR